jgi:omega-6 fatty acid desaturase (delta-12 desaturase)
MKTQTEMYQMFKSTYLESLIHLSQHCFFLFIFIQITKVSTIIGIPLLTLMNVRTFTIFHDCGHKSYSPSPTLNYIIGTFAGIWAMTPLTWSYDHSLHHLTNGNIENKYDYNYNITIYHTKEDFDQFTDIEKYVYKIFRHPAIFFGLLPPVKFFIINRFDYLFYKFFGKYPYDKTIADFFMATAIHNVGLILLLFQLYSLGILPQYLISMAFASTIGTILFHNQHTYNPSYVATNEEWTLKNSSLEGSSCILLPRFLKYFSNGIEYHHIHHLNARIPCYHLEKYHEYIIEQDPIQFDEVVYLSMLDCLENTGLALYDSNEKKYITLPIR